MADESLNTAIAEVAEELRSQIPDADKKEEHQEETEAEVDSEDAEDAQEEQAEELNEDQQKEALRLYKILQDPNQGPAVLAALAQQAGLLGKNTPETPREEAVAKKAIKEILTESLGKEYGFLADKLGPAIEAIFEQERTEQEAKFQQIEVQRVEQQVVAAYNNLAKETKGESRKLEARMVELSKEILPAPDMSVDRYMRILYTVASGGKAQGAQRQNTDRIRQNASDISSRLRTTSGNEKVSQMPDKKMSLKESVAWAQEQLAGRRK